MEEKNTTIQNEEPGDLPQKSIPEEPASADVLLSQNEEIVKDKDAQEEPLQDEETAQEAEEDVQEDASEEDIAPEEEASAERGTKKRKHTKRRIHEVTLENDIKYRGPMSYRWLRIFAWVAIVCAQVSLILSLGMKIDAKLARQFSEFTTFLSLMGTLSVPLFLIANFAVIINAKDGYKRLLAAYGFMVLVIFAVFMLVYQRYLLGIVNTFLAEEGKSPQESFNQLFLAFSTSGYLTFNIFIDLFLCTLFTFFVNYTPSKVFVGKKIIIFRLFALIPVAYEIACIALKMLCVTKEGFVLPLYVAPFLTTKPPITFLVFVALAFFIKNRERVFLKRGKTQAEYNAFLKTNINSLHFSIATSVCLAVGAIIDVVLYFIFAASLSTFGEDGEMIRNGGALAQELGFGRSVPVLLVIPFIMLFSYTRTHKPSSIDIIIPNVGMVAFIICYVEGLYQFILRLPQIINGLFH